MPYEITDLARPIHEVITARQRELNMTDEQLAAALDSPLATLQLIKAGQMKFPIPKVQRLAQALDLPPATLLMRHLSTCMPEVLEAMNACGWMTPLPSRPQVELGA